MGVRVLAESSEDEMVACFLHGELASERFGDGIRKALAEEGLPVSLILDADLADPDANDQRSRLLGATRGYGLDRDLFDAGFPRSVHWVWARLAPGELARVRYIDYSYWNVLSGGSRLACDAADRIRAGVEAFDVPNARFEFAAAALIAGEHFPPMILAGTSADALVCLEGHLRLTAHALAGFPVSTTCLVGTDPTLKEWAH